MSQYNIHTEDSPMDCRYLRDYAMFIIDSIYFLSMVAYPPSWR
jgi:hypothetical protein